MTFGQIVPHLCLRAGLLHAIRVGPSGLFVRNGQLGFQIDPSRPFAPPRWRAFPGVPPPDPFDPEYRRRAARKANP